MLVRPFLRTVCVAQMLVLLEACAGALPASESNSSTLTSTTDETDSASSSDSGDGTGGGAVSTLSGVASIWAVHDGERIHQDDLENAYKFSNETWDGETIRIFGARNEIIAFQLVVEADSSGASNVNIQLDSLYERNGSASILYDAPGEDPTDFVGRPVQVFVENYMNVTEASDAAWIFESGSAAQPSDAIGLVPVQLVPENATKGGLPIDISPNLNQAFWIDVYTGKNIPAGTYDGSIVVSANDEKQTIPIELRIYDFDLPDENSMTAMFYFESEQIELYQGEVLDERYHRFAHRNRIELINEYDVDSAVAVLSRFDGSDFSSSMGYEGPGEGVGNRVLPASMYGPPDAYLEEESAWDASNEWIDFLNENVPQAITFLYMPDEPSSSQYDEINEIAAFIHDNPDSGSALPIFVTKAWTSALDGSIDIWCSSAWAYDIQTAETERTKGHSYWYYNGRRPQTGALIIDSPATDARANLWIAFKHDVETYFYWHADHWQHNWQKVGDKIQNVWANPVTFDNRGQENKPEEDQGFINGDGVIMYPGQEILHPEEDRGIAGPIGTIVSANLRRGLQDHLYLTMAQSLDLEAEVSSALAEVVPNVFSDATETVGYSQHGDDYERVRRSLAEAIEMSLTGESFQTMQ